MPELPPGTVAGFRDGAPDAIREVWRAYGGAMFSVAFRALGTAALAEECAQQAFIRAWRAGHGVDTEREMGPWLYTITRRVAIDIHRREARRPTVDLGAVAPDDANVVTLPAFDQAWEAGQVREAVDALAPDEREIVRLQHFEGLTHAEVAERLGLPVGTVKSRSHRAHKQLAQRLAYLREDST